MRRRPLALVLLCLLSGGSAAETVVEKASDGRVRRRYAVDAQGRKEGPYTEFFPDGRVKIRAQFKAGKPDGPYAEYAEDGRLRVTSTYRAGKLDGTLTRYEQGQPILAQPFRAGAPVYPRSLEQIKETLTRINAAPVSQRDRTARERQAALRRLKAYRFLAGVPYDNLVLNEPMNRGAQAACRICTRLGRMDHKPPNPGLPAADYRLAYQGASSSNLAVGYGTMVEAVEGWMDDSDGRNIAHLGHRRWCLHPLLRQVGFGKVGQFQAMWAFDDSQKTVPDYDWISFPAAGLMPAEYFQPRYAWSVVLNPARYRRPDRAVRPRVHELDRRLGKVGGPLKLNYHTVNTQAYGIANCIIFRPAHVTVAAGRRYLVEIEGVKRRDGQPAGPLRFVVEFASVK